MTTTITDHWEDDFSVNYFAVGVESDGLSSYDAFINFAAVVRDTSGETIPEEILYKGVQNVEISGWVEWEKVDSFAIDEVLPTSGAAHISTSPLYANPNTSGDFNFNQAGIFFDKLPYPSVNISAPHVAYVGIQTLLAVEAVVDFVNYVSSYGVAAIIMVFDEIAAESMRQSGYEVEANVQYLCLTITVSIMEFDFLGPAIVMDDDTELTVSFDSTTFTAKAAGGEMSMTVDEFNAYIAQYVPSDPTDYWQTVIDANIPVGASDYTQPPTVGAGVTACGIDLRVYDWGFDFPGVDGTPTTVVSSGGSTGASLRSRLAQSSQSAGNSSLLG